MKETTSYREVTIAKETSLIRRDFGTASKGEVKIATAQTVCGVRHDVWYGQRRGLLATGRLKSPQRRKSVTLDMNSSKRFSQTQGVLVPRTMLLLHWTMKPTQLSYKKLPTAQKVCDVRQNVLALADSEG